METEASKGKLAASPWWEGWAGALAADPGLGPEERESYRRTLRAFQEFTYIVSAKCGRQERAEAKVRSARRLDVAAGRNTRASELVRSLAS